MKSKFVKTVYEKNGFCIYVYVTEDETVPQAARSNYYKGPGYEFTAIGNNLPANKLEVDLHGAWDKNNHGLQFKVDYYEEIRPQSVEGIESYLASGMVKGIGPKTAKLIVAKYGTRTFEILDDYPESLLDIKGITRKKLDKIILAYQDSHAVRDLAAYLTPFKVTPKKIRKIYEHFGNEALDVVKTQPFSLCEISGFGFLTVDEIKSLIATDCPREDVKRAYLFACFCGLRFGDVAGMKWGDLILDGGQWRVTVVMQKTAKPIYQPLSESAMSWLPERGDASPDDAVFGTLPALARINLMLKVWAKAAGITKRVSFHTSRHSFATMMLTLGADLYTTCKLLGHSNVKTTQIYAKIVDSKKVEAVNLLDKAFG